MSDIKTPVNRTKVRWLIAHHPVELFVRTAKAFVKKIEDLCPGQFEFEILTLSTYCEKYENLYTKEQMDLWKTTTPRISGLENPLRTTVLTSTKQAATFTEINARWKMFFEAMKDGKFEMSQTQVSIVGSHLYSNYHAIDLPYIWNGHDHVSTALDGEIGERLGNAVGDATGIRGLAFTYSGGYRIIGSTDGITSLNDLNNKKFITATATSGMLFDRAGVERITRGLATANDIGDMAEQGGAIETTYLRFEGKNILKTNHSMFMTAVLASDRFLNTLTEEQRQSWKIATKAVAKLERIWSVEDAQKYEDEAVSRGVTIVEASDEDKARLRESAQTLYKASTLSHVGIDASLVGEIISMGKNT